MAWKEMGKTPEQNLQNRNEITPYKKCSDSIKLSEIEYKLLPDTCIIYLSTWQTSKSFTIYIADERGISCEGKFESMYPNYKDISPGPNNFISTYLSDIDKPK